MQIDIERFLVTFMFHFWTILVPIKYAFHTAVRFVQFFIRQTSNLRQQFFQFFHCLTDYFVLQNTLKWSLLKLPGVT